MVHEEKTIELDDQDAEENLGVKEMRTDSVTANDLFGKAGLEDPDKEATRVALELRDAAEKEFESKPSDLAPASTLLGPDAVLAKAARQPLGVDRVGIPNSPSAAPELQNAFRSMLAGHNRSAGRNRNTDNGAEPIAAGAADAPKPPQPLEVGNPPTATMADQSNAADVAIGKIFDLSEANKPAELVDYIKLIKDPALLRIAIRENLRSCDPKNEYLLLLCQDKSPAGLLALESALERGMDVRDIVSQRIKDGSISESIAKGEFVGGSLLVQPAADPKQILKDLMRPIAGDAKKIVALCSSLMGTHVHDSSAKDAYGTDPQMAQQQADKLLELKTGACAELLKQPTELARKALFEMARRGNGMAADALETIISKEVHYAGEHASRRAVPDEAIKKFHEAMKKLAAEHGLTPKELADHQTFSKEQKALAKDIKDLIHSKTNKATSTDRQLRHNILMNELFVDPKLARAGLADQPDLLARYEKLLAKHPTDVEHKARIEKIGEALKPEISKLAEAAGLPKLNELTIGTKDNWHGSYGGLGSMSVSESYSSKDALSSAHFVDTVVHELGHLEQDALQIRYTLEELGIMKSETPVSDAQLEKLSERYAEVWKTRLTREFLDQVRQGQDFTPLTDAEKLRAERLLVSSAMDRRTDARIERVESRAGAIQWFSEQTIRAKSVADLTKILSRESFDAVRARLEKLAGSEIDSKPLLASFDKLRTQIEGGADITSKEFMIARGEFERAAAKSATKLGDVSHQMYRDKFHERDTYAAGAHAEKLLTGGITTSDAKVDRSKGSIEFAATDLIGDIQKKGGPTTAEGKALLKLLDPNGKTPYQQVWTELVNDLGAKRAADTLFKAAQIILDHKMDAATAKDFSQFLDKDGLGINKLANLEETALNRIATAFVDAHPMAKQAHHIGTRPNNESSGFHGQRVMFLGMEQVLKPGNKMYEKGWRVLAAGDQSAADRASVDMVLVNVNDGRWLPLDVKQHSDNKTDFFKKYSLHGPDAICDNKYTPDEAKINTWLSEYIEKKGKDAFNASDVPPPDLKGQTDASARRESLEKHREALQDYLKNAQIERDKHATHSDKYREAQDRITAANDMLNRNVDAERFMDKENRMGISASDSIKQFLEKNVDHFKTNNGASPVQPKDVEEPARRTVEDMVAIKGGALEYKVSSTQKGGDPKVYYPGNLPALLNDAIDNLNISDSDKAAIKKNIGHYGLDRSKVSSPAERALIEQLEKVVREGLSNSAECSEVTSERKRIVSQLYKEQAAKTGENSPLSTESIERAARESDKALHKEVFTHDKKLGLIPSQNPDVSIGNLLTKYHDALASKDGAKIAATLEVLNKALAGTNHLATAQLDAMKGTAPGDRTQLQRVLSDKKSGASVEKCLASAKIVFDSTGTVKPGSPTVQYEISNSRGNKTVIQASDIFSCDSAKGEIILADKDKTRISLQKVRPIITVSATTDSLTLSREVLLGQVIAAHEVTLHDRASRGTAEKPAGITAEQRRSIDCETLADFKESLPEIVKETYRTERSLLAKEIASVWERNHKGVPFPSDPKTMTADQRFEIQLVIEEAVKNVNNTSLDPGQKSRVADLGRQWIRQEDKPDVRDINHIERTPHSDDLLFRPSTTLSKAEADKFKNELLPFGPNPLAEKAAVEQFSRALLEKTRQWTTDSRPDFERQAKLAQEVQAADLKVQATALAEAQEKLGPSAKAEAVKDYANKLIAGTETTAKGSSLELAKKYHAEVRNTHAALSAQISQVAKARALELQIETNKFCREHGLPDIKINVVEHLHGARGSYDPGTGILNIPRAELMDRAGGIRAVNAIYHELTHTQQDQLVIRHLLDERKVKHGRPNDEVYKQIAEDYLKATGHELDRGFLKDVMQLRKPPGASEPIALTPGEREKAPLLAQAFKEAQPFSAIDKALANSERVSLAEKSGLAAAPSANPSQELLKRLSDPANKVLVEHLLGSADSNNWPEDVRRLMRAWAQAPKDARGLNPNWDERSAREILNQHLDQRVAEINQQRAKNHEKYISSFAEKEAHLIGGEVERTTRREYIDALHSAPERAPASVAGREEFGPARERAAEVGIVLADKRKAQDFVDILSKPLCNWRDNLTPSWERGNAQRLEMRQAHDRALALAREHVVASGKQGADAETEARRLLDAPNQEILKKDAFREARDQYIRSRSEYYKDNAPVHDAITNRQQLLQKELDNFCKDHGLPKVKLETRELGSSNAGYERGAGVIAVDPTQLLDRTRSAELLANLTKQLVHSQQDSRIVASIIDRSNGPDTSKAPKPGEVLTVQQIERIKAEYQAQTGSQLNDAFLETVRTQRTAVLNDTQIAHADKVAADFKSSKSLVIDFENAQRDRTNVEAELIKLGAGIEQRSASHLIERLSAPGGEALCKQLFGVNNVNELPAEHPARKLVAQYKDATISGLRPAAETPTWSERKALIELAVVLSIRQEALREAQVRSSSDYAGHRHALEADVLASDVYSESQSRSTETDRLRPQDHQGLDMKEAHERVLTNQNEHKFLDLLSGKLKELHPESEPRNLTREQIKTAMDHVAVDLRIASTTGGKELYGVKLSAQEAEVIAKSGEALTTEFSKEGTSAGGTDAKASETIARVRNHIAPELLAAQRRSSAELPYDPWPPARELAALGEGRTVAEGSENGVRLTRERIGEEWTADKLPTEEQTKKYIEDRIRDLKNEIETKKKNGQTVTAEELAIVDSMEKVHELLKSDPKAYDAMRPRLKAAFNKGRAVVGSSTGVAIIVSAALGFYIKSQLGGHRPPGLSALDLPGA